jgi:hypothetical protein
MILGQPKIFTKDQWGWQKMTDMGDNAKFYYDDVRALLAPKGLALDHTFAETMGETGEDTSHRKAVIVGDSYRSEDENIATHEGQLWSMGFRLLGVS